MTGFVVLSTGLQGRVRAAGPSVPEGAELGVFDFLSGRVAPAGSRRRAAEKLVDRLEELLGPKARGTVVSLVVPDPGDRDVLIAIAERLEARGFVPGILAPRTALARETLRRANRTVGAATWLLDASSAGFMVFSLDGAKRIAVRQDLDQLFEYRRTVVAAAFKAEHDVDIKQVGGSPERIDQWLEELQRSGRLDSEAQVEWTAADGTAMPLRSQTLAKALENVHAAAVVAMENACLEALTEHAGAVVVAGSLDAWFHIGPKLRGALPDTYVHILEEDEEAVLLEGLWERMGPPGTAKVWLLAAGGEAPSDALEWEPLPRAAAPAPAAAVAAPPAPTRTAAPTEARSRTWIYAGMAALAAAQALMVLGYYARGSKGAAGEVKELRGELASLRTAASEERKALRDDLETAQAALADSTGRQSELESKLAESERRMQSDDSSASSAQTQQAIGGLRTDLTALQGLIEQRGSDLGDLPTTVANVVSRLDGVESSLGKLQSEVSAVDERSASRMNGAGEHSQQIEGLTATTADLQARLTDLAGRVTQVDAHEASIAELTQAVSSSQAALEAMSAGGSPEAGALTALSERVDRTESSLRELRGNLQETDGGTLLESLLYPDVSAQRMRVFNEGQSRIARLGEDSEGHGSMKLYNDTGDYTVLLGSGEGGDAGFVGTYGRDGQELFAATSHAGSGAAHVVLNNSAGRRRLAMTTNSNDDAVLWLFNHDGKVVEVLGGGGDLAEAVRPSPGVELRPGMVVRAVGADADGPLVVPADSVADPRVLGILSGAGDLQPAMTFNRTRVANEQAIALAGQVYCLVETRGEPIRPGDLLVSSDTPGHARRADAGTAPQGAVLGKAVEGLAAGTGLIRVWVGPR